MNIPAKQPVERLVFAQEQLESMEAHVERLAPEEACGLLGGRRTPAGGSVELVIPVTNQLHSPIRYRMEPHEQLAALITLETQGLDLLAIYHSHPNGPADPSPTDLAEAYYPEALSVIWHRWGGAWQCRAFRLLPGGGVPVEWVTTEETNSSP